MKSLVTTTLAALTLGMVAIPAQAEQPVTNSAMMVYFQMPFGGKSRKQEIPTYGFRLDTVESTRDNGIIFQSFTGQPAIMDMRFSTEGMQAIEFNGVNALQQKTVYNAAEGKTETTTSIDWGLVAIGAIGVAAILANDDDNDDDDGGMTQIDPPSLQLQ